MNTKPPMSMLRAPNPSCIPMRRFILRFNRKLCAAWAMSCIRLRAPAPACSLLNKNPNPIRLSSVGRS